MAQRAYRYRFYPTAEQENLLRRTMGWCDWSITKLWLLGLKLGMKDKRGLQYKETSSLLTSWKKDEELGFSQRG